MAEYDRYLALSNRLANEIRTFGNRCTEFSACATAAYGTAMDLFTPLSTATSTTVAGSNGADKVVFAGTASGRGCTALQDSASYAHAAYQKVSANNIAGCHDALAQAQEVFTKISLEATSIKTLREKRDASLKEADYYQNKLEGLQKEKEQEVAKGKQYKASDQEKLDRNDQKYRDHKAIYDADHEKVFSALSTFLSTRYDRLEPAMAAFARAQVLFSQGVATAAGVVNNAAVSASNAGAASANIDDFLGSDDKPAVPSRRPPTPPTAAPVNNPEGTEFSVPTMTPNF